MDPELDNLREAVNTKSAKEGRNREENRKFKKNKDPLALELAESQYGEKVSLLAFIIRKPHSTAFRLVINHSAENYMAAFSSPLSCSSSSSSTSFSSETIDAALGRRETPGPSKTSNKIYSIAERIEIIEKICSLVTPFLEVINDYAKANPKGVGFSKQGLTFSPNWFEHLSHPIRINPSKEILISLPTGIINTFYAVPYKISVGLEMCYPRFSFCPPLLHSDEIAALQGNINQLLEPLLQDIIDYSQKLKHYGYWFSTNHEVEALPFGLLFNHAHFKKLSHSVVVGYDRKITILTGFSTKNSRHIPSRELIHPAQMLQNQIDSHLGKLPSRRSAVNLGKFPTTYYSQKEALAAIKNVTNPILGLLQAYAKICPWGTRYSRRKYSKLPYSFYLSRTSELFVATAIQKAKGGYKKQKRIISLENEKKYVVATPLDTGVNFYRELARELRFQDRFKDQPGFLQYMESYIQDSCGLGKPRGMITEEYPFNAHVFAGMHLPQLKKNEKLEVKHRFISDLLNAVEFLHTRNIYHLDLKLSNMLVKPTGEMAIIDFAFAYDPEQKTAIIDPPYHLKDQNVILGGSFNYRPPEIKLTYFGLLDAINQVYSEQLEKIKLTGNCEWNGQSYALHQLPLLYDIIIQDFCRAYDIWSLGVTIYFIIFEHAIEKTILQLVPGQNRFENPDEFVKRLAKVNQDLLSTKDIYTFLGEKKEVFDDNPALQWLLKLFNLDYLKRPTISEIKKEFEAFFDGPKC